MRKVLYLQLNVIFNKLYTSSIYITHIRIGWWLQTIYQFVIVKCKTSNLTEFSRKMVVSLKQDRRNWLKIECQRHTKSRRNLPRVRGKRFPKYESCHVPWPSCLEIRHSSCWTWQVPVKGCWSPDLPPSCRNWLKINLASAPARLRYWWVNNVSQFN